MERGQHDPGAPAAAGPFDLNAHLVEARARLTQAGVATGELDELEDHLREQYADLLARGLRPDEAWWLSERRLGRAPELARELGADGLPPPFVWMALGYFTVSTLSFLLTTSGTIVHHWSGSAAVTAFLVAALIAAAGWSLRRFGQHLLSSPGWTLAALMALQAALVATTFLLTRSLGPTEWLETSFWPQYYTRLGAWSGLLVAAVVSLLLAWRKRRRMAT